MKSAEADEHTVARINACFYEVVYLRHLIMSCGYRMNETALYTMLFLFLYHCTDLTVEIHLDIIEFTDVL